MAFDELCLTLSDFTFLAYHLTLYPFVYHQDLQDYAISSYTHPDLVTLVRRKQHAYHVRILEYLETQCTAFQQQQQQHERKNPDGEITQDRMEEEEIEKEPMHIHEMQKKNSLEDHLHPYLQTLEEMVGSSQVRSIRAYFDKKIHN